MTSKGRKSPHGLLLRHIRLTATPPAEGE